MKLERFYDFANWKQLSWNSKSGFLTLKYLLSVVQVNHSHCFWVFTYLVFTHQELSLHNFILSSNNWAELLLPPVYPVQKFLEKPSDSSKARQVVEERWQSRESDVKAQVTEDHVTLCLHQAPLTRTLCPIPAISSCLCLRALSRASYCLRAALGVFQAQSSLTWSLQP